MKLELRKFTKFLDKTLIEGGKESKEPVLLVSVAAVFKNPWHGQGFVEDLKPIILDLAPKLGDILVPELIKEIGSPEKILAYGKAGIVGLKGEIEHASAFIHTLRFGNKFRDAVGGTSYLSFTNTRGPAGSKISIPMMHKTDAGLRPYYLTHEFTIHDAPFDKVAELYGAKGFKVKKVSEVNQAVREALKINRPVVIDVDVDPKALYSFRRDSFKHRSTK